MTITENKIKKYNWKPDVLWKKRTKLIADIIIPKSGVIDLGGGYENLKKFLDNCIYYSIDNFKCTKDTILADFNLNEYPMICNDFDYIVCQGILEYIKEPEIFLKKIKRYGSTLLLTYRKNSPAPVWRNEYSFKTIKKMLNRNGWEVIFSIPVIKEKELLLYCKKCKRK